MKKAVVALFLVWSLCGCERFGPEKLFVDDFEDVDCLNNWVVGGRQLEGTNIANCEMRDGSVRGHLLKVSFTEITLTPGYGNFPFSDSLTFEFDMEVRVSSTGGAPSAYYGQSGAIFTFYNTESTPIGGVSYIAATTQFPFDNVKDNPISAAVPVAENVNAHYVLGVEEILSYIDIDKTEIATVGISFNTYSSTRPSPYVETELWIDNVIVSHIP